MKIESEPDIARIEPLREAENENGPDPECVAWHEAGHAIVAGALGMPVEIDVMSSTRVEGYLAEAVTQVDTWGTLANGTTGYELIPVLFAGYLAERAINPDRGDILRGAVRDLVMIEELNPYSNPMCRGAKWRRETFPTQERWRSFIRGQLRIASRLLCLHWRAHQRLVRVLFECNGEMTKAEFKSFARRNGLDTV